MPYVTSYRLSDAQKDYLKILGDKLRDAPWDGSGWYSREDALSWKADRMGGEELDLIADIESAMGVNRYG